jgi:hypothetical protein
VQRLFEESKRITGVFVIAFRKKKFHHEETKTTKEDREEAPKQALTWHS